MNPPNDFLLRVSGLTARMPYLTIRSVSLDVVRGQAVGIMGASGSGKSTLLRMLALFIKPTGGWMSTRERVWEFDGSSSIAPNALTAHRRRVVYVSQANTLWPHLTLRENIEFGPRRVLHLRHDESHARADMLLHALDLHHVAASRTWTVSGGEARRGAVARALALEPDVILLDEPETGLDPIRAARQMDLILTTCERAGTGAVIVSHNPSTILRATTVTHVVHAGGVVESGPTKTVLNCPGHPETQALLAAAGAGVFGSAPVIRKETYEAS